MQMQKVEINLLHLKKDKNVKCVWSTVSESTESGNTESDNPKVNLRSKIFKSLRILIQKKEEKVVTEVLIQNVCIVALHEIVDFKLCLVEWN